VLGDRSKCFTGLTAHRKKGLIIQAMNSVDHHHANSVLLYNELKSYDLKPFYLPNGVDENLFHPILPHFHQRSNLTIGHVGKKSPLKNQKKFIEPLFKDLDVDYNPCYNQFGNKVPHEQMVDKYQEFDLFLAASSEDGTPNGMLEAAACERATIINKIGNAPELIRDGHNGFLLNMDQAEYIDKIKWCQDNKDKVVEMGKNARQEILKG
jgi:glycosyltransferase involved in cell wall biosynthesis